MIYNFLNHNPVYFLFIPLEFLVYVDFKVEINKYPKDVIVDEYYFILFFKN
jgi:hypothetical protein